MHRNTIKSTLPALSWSIFFAWGLVALVVQPGRSQIVPDTTLPDNSTVTPQGDANVITGGTRRGNNVFHSFESFSVPTNSAAFFDNPVEVNNIINRVTGSELSDIDGTLSANGAANVFLLNPNGIRFGENARLQIGGSFIGTTADALEFADGGVYSATDPAASPLLSINVPIGLQFGNHPGTITHRSRSGFAVPSDRSLTLIGGNLNVIGGRLSAPQGRIHLAAVADSGLVRFDSDSFDYRNIDRFGNIEITDSATLDTSGVGSGAIQIRGGNIAVTSGSQILARTLGNLPGRDITIRAREFQTNDALVSTTTFGSGSGGALIVRADDRIALSGRGFANLQQNVAQSALTGQLDLRQVDNGLFTGTEGTGAAGDLTLESSRVQLSEGMSVTTITGDAGKGGNIMTRASDSVEIAGSLLITGSLRETTGNSGDLTLQTQRLSISQGGLLQTLTLGTGTGGNLTVNATELVELRDSPSGSIAPTGIFANTIFGNGIGGNIEVNTRRLTLSDGSQIGNQTGARLATGVIPLGGLGGNIVLNVSEAIEIGGSSPDGQFDSILGATSWSNAPAGSITINTSNLTIREGGSIGASAAKSGAAGFLTINADNIVVRSRIFVNSRGSGNAGTLEINANQLQLNGGRLTASTVSGTGGNIRLDTDVLQLRRGSQITTNAGNTDGGNINISAETIVALENSDITANALEGRGGRVEIAAQGIFGTQFRDRTTPESDITATSQLGAQFDGTVSLETPDIDPASGLVDLPEITTDSGNIVVRGCAAESGNRFVIVGRGGLPDDPSHAFSGRSPWRDWRPADNNENGAIAPQSELPPLVEAQHWVVDANGRVQLVARTSDRISADLDPTCDRPSIDR